MGNVNADGTYHCAHEGCGCKVADDESTYQNRDRYILQQRVLRRERLQPFRL